MNTGLFLTFEGIDGCGKTTQLARLAQRLRGATARNVVETVEPGGTETGRQIRAILLNPSHQALDARAELLLYFASRAQNVAEVIKPSLAQDAIVLCDRFTDSTIVYQGAGRGIDREAILALDRIACDGLRPKLTLLLDIDLETSLARARRRNRDTASDETRFDDLDCAFFERVRDGYRELARAEPARIHVIDARDAIDQVAARIWGILEPHV